jgi:N-acetylneuraminic acid mutarotase
VLFGGNTGGVESNETWTRDATGWTLVTTASAPPAREGHAMTALGGKVVLFGGWLDPFSVSFADDTWIYDGATWTQAAQAQTPPPARNLHAMATLNGSAVLFGGGGPTGELADTWTWDGQTWTQRSVVGPSPREGHAMAALGGKVVLFGGETLGADGGPQFLDDTWTWDGAAWTSVAVATAPPGRADHVMFTLGSAVVLFGGVAATGVMNDTWRWDGSAWTSVDVASPPSARVTAAVAAAGGMAVLFGGADANGFILGDAYTWDGTSWSPLAGAQAPSARSGPAMASIP